jgi:hypothetical protein
MTRDFKTRRILPFRLRTAALINPILFRSGDPGAEIKRNKATGMVTLSLSSQAFFTI